MTQKELYQELKAWFLRKKGNRNMWSDNPVGRLIQQELYYMAHWKAAPRGNPSKGQEIMKCNKAKKEEREQGDEEQNPNYE